MQICVNSSKNRSVAIWVQVSIKPLKNSKYQITKKGKNKILTLPTRDEHTQHRLDSVSDISRVAGPVP
jgi:hypothetical protein